MKPRRREAHDADESFDAGASLLETSHRSVEGGSVFDRRIPGDPQRPSFVLLHGVPVTSAVYLPLAREIRLRFVNSVILADLPGLGRSAVAGHVSWSSQRSVLGAWLREQGRVILVVHDIAGPIALPLLADERIDVSGVVLLNTILEPSSFRPLVTMQLLRVPGLGAVLARATPRWLYVRSVRALGLSRPERVEPCLLDELYAETFRGGRWRDLYRTMRGFELDHASDQAIGRGLSARDAPCLAIWAASDPALGTQRQHLAQLAPGCPVHLLPGARHFLMLDHAAEIAQSLLQAGVERW